LPLNVKKVDALLLSLKTVLQDNGWSSQDLLQLGLK